MGANKDPILQDDFSLCTFLQRLFAKSVWDPTPGRYVELMTFPLFGKPLARVINLKWHWCGMSGYMHGEESNLKEAF